MGFAVEGDGCVAAHGGDAVFYVGDIGDGDDAFFIAFDDGGGDFRGVGGHGEVADHDFAGAGLEVAAGGVSGGEGDGGFEFL